MMEPCSTYRTSRDDGLQRGEFPVDRDLPQRHPGGGPCRAAGRHGGAGRHEPLTFADLQEATAGCPSPRPPGCSPPSSAASCSSATPTAATSPAACSGSTPRGTTRGEQLVRLARPGDGADRRRHPRDRPPQSSPAATRSCRSPRSTPSYLLGTRDWTQVDVPGALLVPGQGVLGLGRADARRAAAGAAHPAHPDRRGALSSATARRPASAAGRSPSTSSRRASSGVAVPVRGPATMCSRLSASPDPPAGSTAASTSSAAT